MWLCAAKATISVAVARIFGLRESESGAVHLSAAVVFTSHYPTNRNVCVLCHALSVIVSVADREPFAAGLNVTLMTQLLPAASEVPQLGATTKSVAFASRK